MDQQVAERIRILEQRVHSLTIAVIALTIGLAFVSGLLPLTLTGFLVLLPILVFTHPFLPKIARYCGRWFSFARRTFSFTQPQ